MRVVYYPMHFDGAGCYRCVYPGTQLKARGGHDVEVGAYEILEQSEKHTVMRFFLDTSIDADLVVLQQPGNTDYVAFQKALQARGIRVVIDMDDDHFHLPSYNPASRDKTHSRSLLWCVRHADAVTVTTPALRDSVSRITSAPIYVLRNFLDWRVWKHVPPVYEGRTWERFRVGYMGMAAWHSGDLQTLNPFLGEWLRDHPDVDFVAVGDPEVHDLLGVPEEQRVSVESFSFRLQKIAKHLATMDVGLVPLARNQFNEAKSHLKGMEYAGVGIPCLASPTESYRDWWLSGESAGEGGSGYLCDRPEEWLHALDRLYADQELRVAMGERARLHASQNTYQDHWRLWENAYSEILGAARPSSRRLIHSSGKTVDQFGAIL